MTDIFNLILHSNTFNFVIFLSIIIIICKLVDIPMLIENMCEKIKTRINDSDNAQKQASDKKAQALKSIENTTEEIADINTNAKEKTKTLKNQIKNDTEIKIQNIHNNTAKIIDSEEKLTTSALISNIGLKSLETAKTHIIKEIENDKELHSKFIDDSIEELKRAVLNDIY